MERTARRIDVAGSLRYTTSMINPKTMKVGDAVEITRIPYGRTEPVTQRGVIDHAREDGWMLCLDNGDYFRAMFAEVTLVLN